MVVLASDLHVHAGAASAVAVDDGWSFGVGAVWDSPSVAHDNPDAERFHASAMLGFAHTTARDGFYASSVIDGLSDRLRPVAPAIHAYDVTAALTYVKNGVVLPYHEE
jgi:hypothetical protein